MAYDLNRLPLRDFCRHNTVLELDLAAAQLPRFSAALHSPLAEPAHVNLSANEQRRADGSVAHELAISVSATVQLECQRCLEAFSQPLASTSRFVLVKDEAAADAYEAQQADASSADTAAADTELELAPEPLPADQPCDVMALIEDELLLALPLVARHTVCPKELVPGLLGAVTLDAVPAEPAVRVSPFAALGNLKKTK
jgi:uncharacterized protein